MSRIAITSIICESQEAGKQCSSSAGVRSRGSSNNSSRDQLVPHQEECGTVIHTNYVSKVFIFFQLCFRSGPRVTQVTSETGNLVKLRRDKTIKKILTENPSILLVILISISPCTPDTRKLYFPGHKLRHWI